MVDRRCVDFTNLWQVSQSQSVEQTPLRISLRAPANRRPAGPNAAASLARAALIRLTVHPPQTKTKNGLLATQSMLSSERMLKVSILLTLEASPGGEGERRRRGMWCYVRGCARYERIIRSQDPGRSPPALPAPPCSPRSPPALPSCPAAPGTSQRTMGVSRGTGGRGHTGARGHIALLIGDTPTHADTHNTHLPPGLTPHPRHRIMLTPPHPPPTTLTTELHPQHLPATIPPSLGIVERA